jgi:AraC-like DNA-binding protein
MHETLRGVDRDRLERSCGPGADSIRLGGGAPGIEWADVRLTACAFSPHRNDTYAIGITVAGVQMFHYRGERRICLPGQLHVLHPDEIHDGRAGTDAGFGYRILYVEPELVREALGGAPLPFVPDPVHDARPETAELRRLVAEVEHPVTDLERHEVGVVVADALDALAGRPGRHDRPLDLAAMERVRDHLAAHAREQAPAAELERISGLDRYTLARQFRRAYGTSPDRYRTMRRLRRARDAIGRGVPLAAAAFEAGFADQSHMTRQFGRAYGMTPGRWARTVRMSESLP